MRLEERVPQRDARVTHGDAESRRDTQGHAGTRRDTQSHAGVHRVTQSQRSKHHSTRYPNERVCALRDYVMTC